MDALDHGKAICYKVFCCGEIENPHLRRNRNCCGGVAALTLVALSIIATFIIFTYVTKAAGLTTGINPAKVQVWANAAKWCTIPLGIGIGYMGMIKCADKFQQWQNVRKTNETIR